MLLSATITNDDAQNVARCVGIEGIKLIKSNILHRPNLEYSVVPQGQSPAGQVILRLITNLDLLQRRGIIYCATPKHCEKMKEQMVLNPCLEHRLSVYHAKLNSAEKEASLSRWSANAHHIMIATSAFGLGINQPDVRFVIHSKMPTSTSTFLQESGRAGRDGLPAKCVAVVKQNEQRKVADFIVTYDRQAGSTEDRNLLIKSKRRALKGMEVYFENKLICRRTFHEYFFSPEKVSKLHDRLCLSTAFLGAYPDTKPCDVCITAPTLRIVDVKDAVRDIYQIVRFFTDNNQFQNVTSQAVTDIYLDLKGSRQGQLQLAVEDLKQSHTWMKNTLLHKDTVMELIQWMIWLGVLDEQVLPVKTPNEKLATYLMCDELTMISPVLDSFPILDKRAARSKRPVVERPSQDPRVDVSACDNRAIQSARTGET